MSKDIFNIKKMKSVKSTKYKILLTLSFIIGGGLPSVIINQVIIKLGFPNHIYWLWGFSFIWGAIYGIFEPVSIYYKKKFSRIYKKIDVYNIYEGDIIKSFNQNYMVPTVLSELLTYNRIKPNDIIATEISYHSYIPFTQHPANELISTLKILGITPKELLKSSRYPKQSFVVFFKDKQDYFLTKMVLSDKDKISFYHGKKLLDYVNRN